MNNNFMGICAHVQGVLESEGSHGMDHIMRVTRLCEIIGMREHAELDILIPAALLHDIARPVETARGIPHETEGARLAEDYLLSIHYNENLIPGIVQAIRTHRFSSAELPGTLEARILSDADKLDAMGAVGIARTFMRAGETGGSFSNARHHFDVKLLTLKDIMYTSTAREIAEKRHAFLVLFIANLDDELNLTYG